jgi:lysozyme
MTASPDCYNIIKRAEGLRLKPYTCPSGLATIGYGHTHGVCLTDPPCMEEEAEMWLREDVGMAESIVNGRVHVPITQEQFDALCSFVYNLGGEKFTETSCTLLRWLNAGQASELIAEQFDRWVYGRDPQTGRAVKLPGLISRRAAERMLFQRPPDLPEAA